MFCECIAPSLEMGALGSKEGIAFGCVWCLSRAMQDVRVINMFSWHELCIKIDVGMVAPMKNQR